MTGEAGPLRKPPEAALGLRGEHQSPAWKTRGGPRLQRGRLSTGERQHDAGAPVSFPLAEASLWEAGPRLVW